MKAIKPIFVIFMLFVALTISAQTHKITRGGTKPNKQQTTTTKKATTPVASKKAGTVTQRRSTAMTSQNRRQQSSSLKNSGQGASSSSISQSKENSIIKLDNLLNNFDIPLPLNGVSEQILSRKGYIVSYNKDTKVPNWVAWRLSAEHIRGKAQWTNNAWHEDFDVSMPRATNRDYESTNWDHGHMCPPEDNMWNSDALYETFLYTNCCPQNAILNDGTWNQIEIACRQWAEKYGELDIVCGPIFFRQQHETIGDNKVVVPEAFFKVIVCMSGDTPKGIAFILRNSNANKVKDLHVNYIKEVERITGITFFPHLPKELAESIKNKVSLDDWDTP